MRCGRVYVMIGGWTGLDAAGHTREPLDNLNLTHCEPEAAIAVFEQATGRPLPRPAPLFGPAGPPPPIPTTGFRSRRRHPAT